MCTISFVPVDQSHWILGMNRDERKNRPKAKTPALTEHESGTQYLAPVDTEAGGTWIAINQYGLTLLLINNYQALNPELAHRSDALSRGLVIPQMMGKSSASECISVLEKIEAERYNPFTLFVFSQREQRITSYAWNGKSTRFEDLPVEPFVKISSGFDPEEAYRIRSGVFREKLSEDGKVTVDWMKSLLQSTHPGPGAVSIAMLQEKVMSVSAIVLKLTPQQCESHYFDGWPGGEGNWEINRIALNQS